MQAKEMNQSIEVDGIKRTIKLYVFTTGFADLDGFLMLDTYHSHVKYRTYTFTTRGYKFTVSDNIKLTSRKLYNEYYFDICADTIDEINSVVNRVNIFEELFTYNGEYVDISFKGIFNGKVGLSILVKALGLALSWDPSINLLDTSRSRFIRKIEDRTSRITVFSKIAGEYHAGYYRQLKEINNIFDIDSYSMVISDGTQETEFLDQLSLESAIKQYICVNEKSDIRTITVKPKSRSFTRTFSRTPK